MCAGRGSAEGEPTVCMCLVSGRAERGSMCGGGGGVLKGKYVCVGRENAEGEVCVCGEGEC